MRYVLAAVALLLTVSAAHARSITATLTETSAIMGAISDLTYDGVSALQRYCLSRIERSVVLGAELASHDDADLAAAGTTFVKTIATCAVRDIEAMPGWMATYVESVTQAARNRR